MLGGGLDFVIPKTSTVSPKANTADSRAGRKKGKKKNKSRVPRHRKTWRSKIRGHESKAFSPLVTFPGALRGLDSKANSSSLTNVICNFADRGTCCCVLSNLLGICMRFRTGGEPGVHLRVRWHANPIWYYGAAMVTPLLWRRGVFIF